MSGPTPCAAGPFAPSSPSRPTPAPARPSRPGSPRCWRRCPLEPSRKSKARSPTPPTSTWLRKSHGYEKSGKLIIGIAKRRALFSTSFSHVLSCVSYTEQFTSSTNTFIFTNDGCISTESVHFPRRTEVRTDTTPPPKSRVPRVLVVFTLMRS